MKKIILVLMAVLLVCASAGCIEEEEKPLLKLEYDDYRVYTYVDEYSGVEYVYITNLHGYSGLAPRYNADGTLKINEEFRK